MKADALDVVIVGGGIVGLATAYRILQARPEVRLSLLEREPELATHQSGHNSGVLHAGLYYAPGSLKARLCREGKSTLDVFAAEHAIPIERTGKLVVALREEELPRLADIRERALANRVVGLETLGRDQIRELEPHAAGIRALWSPTTAIIDFRRVALAIANEVRAMGASIETGREVTGVTERQGALIVATTHGEVVTRNLVACAGVWADKVADMTRDAGAERIVPFRGDYYTLKEPARRLVRGLIYPVPDPRFPFLGVHFTKRIDGNVWAGPNAVLALARTGYRRRDLSLRDLAENLRYRGFQRLARRYWRTGLAEIWRDVSKRAFAAELRRYIPELQNDDLVFGPSGIRAQAVDPDGSIVDDFRLGGSAHVLHVRNAPSPAATASLAIGRHLAEAAAARFWAK